MADPEIPPGMVGGEAATRIMREVMAGRITSKDDTSDQAAYRLRIRNEVEEIYRRGQMVEMPKDWQ